MNIEEARKEVENYLDYEGSISITAIATLYTAYEKQSKEIEELKANKGYHLGFIDGGIAKRYEYEDKIIAKVKEIKNRPVKDEFITATQGKLNTIKDIENLLYEEEKNNVK